MLHNPWGIKSHFFQPQMTSFNKTQDKSEHSFVLVILMRQIPNTRLRAPSTCLSDTEINVKQKNSILALKSSDTSLHTKHRGVVLIVAKEEIIRRRGRKVFK